MLSDIIKSFEDRAILEKGDTMNRTNNELKINEVVLNKGTLERYKKTQYGGYLSHFRCNGNTKGVLFIHKSALAGAVNVEKKTDGHTWIQALEVNHEFQRKGLGMRLVKRAQAMGATNLSVEKGNVEAIHMYLKAGFKGYKDTGNQYFMSTKNMGSEIPIKDTLAKSTQATTPVKESFETPVEKLTESVEINPDGDTIINLQNFENGLFNFILVIGLPGSGKGCFGREISKKYNAKHLELDIFDQCGNMSDVDIRKAGEPFSDYILNTSEGRWYRKNAETLSLNEKLQGNHDFILYAIGYAKAHKDQIFILDGTPIYAAMEPEEIKNYPLVIKGTNASQSFENKVGRDVGKGSSDKLHSNVSGADLDGLLNYYWNDWRYLNKFKNDVADKAENNEVTEEACKDVKTAREFVQKVGKLTKKYDANYFIVTDGASGISNNGNPAVKHARDAQIEWEKKNGFDPDEYWSKENFNEAGKPLKLEDVIKKYVIPLHHKLNKFGYGVVKDDHLVDIKDGPTFANLYRTMSCKEFVQYQGGICWDYARFQHHYLKHLGLPAENYYLEINDANSSTHTFTVIPIDGKYIYLESSFLRIQGVYIGENLDVIIQFILQAMNFDPRKNKIFVRSYDDPKPGLTTLQFMDYCVKKGSERLFSYSVDAIVVNRNGDLRFEKK